MARYLLTPVLYLKVLLAYVLGIVICDFITGVWRWVLPFFLFGIFSVVSYYFRIRKPKFTDHSVFVLLIYAGMVVHYTDHEIPLAAFHGMYQNHATGKIACMMRVDESPLEKESSYRIEGRLLEFQNEDTTITTSTKIILYTKKADLVKNLNYGDLILFRTTLQLPRRSHYDFEFDYGNYLSRKRIYATAYTAELNKLNRDLSLFDEMRYFPKKIRDYFITVFNQNIEDTMSRTIAKSVLIGVRSEIDEELMQAYSNTGTIHILSVSGLHFSMLIGLIGWLLSRFTSRPLIMAILKHSFSFLYALITGFSAPVFRSFLMFLLFDIEKTSRVRPSALNVLFLSAWVILLFDTNQLFDIGFQLSYIALLGLILWQKRIELLIQFDTFIMHKTWQLFVGIMIATFFTMPLTIYYFHKVSMTGLLSNFIVVPLTAIIMWTGFGMLLISWIDPLVEIFGQALNVLLLFQNKVILWFSKWPFSVYDRAYMNQFELVVAIIVMISLQIFLWFKGRIELRILAFTSVFFLSILIWNNYSNMKEEKWFITPSYKQVNFILKRADHLFVFADSIEPKSKHFFIDPLCFKYDINPESVHRMGLRSYFSGMKYGISQDQSAQYMILCKENKPFWFEYIKEHDSFIISSNVSEYHKTALEDSILRQKKQIQELE